MGVMTNKIETTPFRAPASPEKKKGTPEPKKDVSSKWQTVEERKEAPKQSLVKNQKPLAPKKPFGSKDREGRKHQIEKDLSPFELFSAFQVKPVQEREADVEFTPVEEEEEVSIALLDEKAEDKEIPKVQLINNISAPFSQDSGLNTSHATAASPIASSTFQNMKLLDFCDKLVKKITAMKLGGRTEITLTLKNLSLFNGGVLKVVEHDSARGQYNVIFTNLNPKAHALVTSNYAERLLKESLEAKGLSFHMITATTEIEPITSFAADSKGERDHRDEDPSQEDESESA